MKKTLLMAGLCLFLQPVHTPATSLHSTIYSSVKKNEVGLSIHFISKGTGIDHETYDKIEQFLKEHPKKPSYTVHTGGKEGEKTIYVAFGSLTKKEQKALEKDINALITKKDMVLVKKVKKIRAAF